MKSEIGIVGLGVMGKSIAFNFINNKINTSLFNRSKDKLAPIMEELKNIDNATGFYNLEQFVISLETPRKILLMVSAGKAVDSVVESLIPLLSKGDIIIDGGNSMFTDTHRRVALLKEHELHFIGMGISGGEKGALLGPSMMPSGDKQIVDKLVPLLEIVSAKAPNPCVINVGNRGAGHFVKMVHNGIEYAEMQLISELYSFAKISLKLDNNEIYLLFKNLNQGELSSYLLEITCEILQFKDGLSDGLLLDIISDRAKAKGTGQWTVESSLDLSVSAPSIYAAVDSRSISSMTQYRQMISKLYKDIELESDKTNVGDSLTEVMMALKLIIYTQGLSLIETASNDYNFEVDLPGLLRIWKGGCIIRSELLEKLAFSIEVEKNANVIAHPVFVPRVKAGIDHLRAFSSASIFAGVPIPCTLSALTYFDSLRSDRLGTSLIQAQRDFFGAHTYERIDGNGTHHTKWEK